MSVYRPEASLLLPSNLTWKNFTELTKVETQQVLDWRNDPEIRRWMRTDAAISQAEHDLFIESLKHSKDKLYYLLSRDEEPIGVADFYQISEATRSCYYGYYLNPSLIGTSVGILMEFWVAEMALVLMDMEELIAETRPDNRAATELHQFFGFESRGINSDYLEVTLMKNKVWMKNRTQLSKHFRRIFEV